MTPTATQGVFLAFTGTREVGYGGAAGGGKSAALLMSALQYVETPRYHALLLRRTFADLNLPESLIPLSHEWLSGKDAQWSEQKHQWRFPSGATLTFGYCENERDIFRYQGPAFAFVGWDELTQFTRRQYLYLFSRLRRRSDLILPLRVRSATNPGGIGHDWVLSRFFVPEGEPKRHKPVWTQHRKFVPARLEDNPYLDRVSYEESLAELDPVTRAQLQHGDWEVMAEGNLFKRGWFTVVEPDRVPQFEQVVRCWDLAATVQGEKGNADPDWLAGVKMGVKDGRYYILHVHKDRTTPEGVEKAIKSFAATDGRSVSIRLEQEGAASGKIVAYHFTRMLDGYDARFTGIPKSAKAVRAGPFSAASQRGDVFIVRGTWNDAFLDELCAFPQDGVHDDQVDGAVGAYEALQSNIEMADNRGWLISAG